MVNGSPQSPNQEVHLLDGSIYLKLAAGLQRRNALHQLRPLQRTIRWEQPLKHGDKSLGSQDRENEKTC